jgi:hypothetical protein
MNRRSLIIQIIIVAGLLIAAFFLFSSMGAFSKKTVSRSITLRVEASGGYANITYEAGSQRINETTTVSTPWERKVVVPRGKQVYLTAANPSQTGQISCSIRLDGKAWKSDKIETPKDGVACAGIVP